ncbi:hypothetical protein EfmAA96_10210 [Enterococcus faecium]|nr:hypothetical protein EfmAA96_10210 [Enterococcus faecium]
MNDFTTEIVQTLVCSFGLRQIFYFKDDFVFFRHRNLSNSNFSIHYLLDRTGFNSGNSRNGSYFRSIKTEYGELTLEIPRDRNGEFKQQTLPAYKRTNDTLETTIIHLFEKGVTSRAICSFLSVTGFVRVLHKPCPT